MRIESVEIKNGCQHRAFKGEFGPGVIVVEGPNGAGKSNLIKLIVRGLTGLSMNFGKKEDDLTYNESHGYVKVEFSVGGQKGVIQRNLKSAACKMTFGGRDYKTVKEIDEAIFNILGISPKVMAEIVMAQQGKIESVLFQPPAERARSMQELFGTLHAEKIREVLAEDLSNTPVASRADTIKQLEDGLKVTIDTPLEQARKDMEDLKKATLSDEDKARHEEIVHTYETQQSIRTTLASAAEEKMQCETKLRAHDAQLKNKIAAYDENQKVLDELQPLVVALREKIRSAGEKKMLKAQRDEAVKQLAECARELSLPEPACRVTPTEVEEARSALFKLRGQVESINAILRNVGGRQTCPTCFQPVSPELIQEHRNRYQEMSTALAAMTSHFQAMESDFTVWQRQHAQWSAAVSRAAEMHARLQNQISKLPEVSVPSDAELIEDQKTVGDFDALEKTQNQLKSDIVNLSNFRETLVEQLNKATSRLEAASKYDSVVGDKTLYENSKRLLDKHANAVLAIAAVAGKIATLETQRDVTLKQIATLKDEESKLAKVKEWRELVDRARQVLHRDQLPNLVAQAYIRALNGRLAKYLEMFEVPYTCKIASDMSVICAFSGGRQLPAERLSGGEKVMLGIAFRFAIYDLFASNLGLLILDEPTVFLDEDRIDSVYDLLERVKSYSKSAGLQLIVITHEKKLVGVADRVISL